MKGLIYKDLYMLTKYMRMFILMLLIFAVTSIWSDQLFFAVYPMVLTAVIPVSLISYDERFRWDVYCGALPCSRAAQVSAKYLTCLIIFTVAFLLSAVTQFIRAKTAGDSLGDYVSLMCLLISIGMLGSGVMLPIIFRLGVEKGRIAYYVVIVGAMVLSYMIPEDMLSGEVSSIPIAALAAVAVAVFAASWPLSIKLYEKRSYC